MKHTISLEVNGLMHRLEVPARRLLIDVIREDLGLTGTKRGCESSICGICTLLVDGRSVHACCVFAVQVNGKRIATIEGLSQGGRLHPVQQAFVDHLGYQCGFCTPGMIMSSVALLGENADPTDEQIRLGLTGNVCRCTGYVKIIKSVQAAAAVMRAAGERTQPAAEASTSRFITPSSIPP
jgi:carbon-monoxide dehydrogenase small subunit